MSSAHAELMSMKPAIVRHISGTEQANGGINHQAFLVAHISSVFCRMQLHLYSGGTHRAQPLFLALAG